MGNDRRSHSPARCLRLDDLDGCARRWNDRLTRRPYPRLPYLLGIAAAGALAAAAVAFLVLFAFRGESERARGDRIAYSCKEPKNPWYAICVVRTDGSGTERVLRHVAATNPKWSPDGRRIAFTRREDVGGEYTKFSEDDVFVMDADGTDLRQLTPDRAGIHAGQPAWSPDGRSLVFVRGASVPSALVVRPGSLFVMNADGSDMRRLTRNWLDAGPAWSPDGREIVFNRSRSFTSPSRGIWTMSAVGGRPRELTHTASFLDGAPAWSPDGTRIAFVRLTRESQNDGNAAIYVMSRDGRHLRLVVRQRLFSFFSYGLAWSPDGRTIAFETSPSRLCTAIALVDVTSGRIRPLTACTRPRESALAPSWQPDVTTGAP